MKKPRASRLTLAALVVALFTATLAFASASTPFPPFHPKLIKGVPGALTPAELKLWKYDSSTGKYTVVSGNASKPYVAHVRKAPKKWVVAFSDPWAANIYAIPIRKTVYQYAKQAGIKIIYCDSNFKPDQAINCADQLSSQHPDFAIAGNWQAGVAPALARIWSRAKIPTEVIDVAHPNSIFFGLDNYAAGRIAGLAAGKFALKKWNCKDTWVLRGVHKEEGEAGVVRMNGFSDGVQEICGTLPKGHISDEILAAATTDQAITVTTDWLTAHPEAKHIVGSGLDDERPAGMGKAFVAQHRDGYAIGQGCDAFAQSLIKRAPAAKTGYLGCVALFPEHYGQYLISIAEDVLSGKPVPQEVHLKHLFLDRSNIKKYYP